MESITEAPNRVLESSDCKANAPEGTPARQAPDTAPSEATYFGTPVQGADPAQRERGGEPSKTSLIVLTAALAIVCGLAGGVIGGAVVSTTRSTGAEQGMSAEAGGMRGGMAGAGAAPGDASAGAMPEDAAPQDDAGTDAEATANASSIDV